MRDPYSPMYQLASKLANEAFDPANPDHLAGQAIDAPRYFADKAARILGIPVVHHGKVVESAPRTAPAPAPLRGDNGQNRVLYAGDGPGGRNSLRVENRNPDNAVAKLIRLSDGKTLCIFYVRAKSALRIATRSGMGLIGWSLSSGTRSTNRAAILMPSADFGGSGSSPRSAFSAGSPRSKR